MEGSLRRAQAGEIALQRSAAAVAIIETDVARGMGFVIDPAGYLLTNRHVIEDADHVEGVVFPALDPNRVYGSVRVVYIDPVRDLALLQVHANEPFTAVPLATDEPDHVSSYLASEDPVVLMQRDGQGQEPLRILRGEVSGLEVYNPAAGPGAFVGVTNEVLRGQSGGPVLDRHGRAVGVVTWAWRDKEGGFAIPIADATRMLSERPQLDADADRRARAELRTRLFLDAVARGDGGAARRFTSPSQARKQREETVTHIMARLQSGDGLELMTSFVTAMEAVVAEAVRADDAAVVEEGLDALLLGVAQPNLHEVLDLGDEVDVGQVLSFFHELGQGYLSSRVFAEEDREQALRAAISRLNTIDAARSFALATLVVDLDDRDVSIEGVKLVPSAYTPGARVELQVTDPGGESSRYDLHLRLEWGDWYVASLEPLAIG